MHLPQKSINHKPSPLKPPSPATATVPATVKIPPSVAQRQGEHLLQSSGVAELIIPEPFWKFMIRCVFQNNLLGSQAQQPHLVLRNPRSGSRPLHVFQLPQKSSNKWLTVSDMLICMDTRALGTTVWAGAGDKNDNHWIRWRDSTQTSRACERHRLIEKGLPQNSTNTRDLPSPAGKGGLDGGHGRSCILW